MTAVEIVRKGKEGFDMSICPSCGKEVKEGALRCGQCGNPLTEGRPWDKKTKEQLEQEAAAEEEAKVRRADKEGQIKVQTVIRSNLPRRSMKKRPVDPETYLNHDFVVGMSLCGFSETPGDKKSLTSGTVILTKEALLFGRSEYDIKCGHYKVEIPLDFIASFGEAMDGSKKLIAVRTIHGEIFYLFVAKRGEWLDFFRFAMGQENQPEVATPEKEKVVRKWSLVASYIVIAFSAFVMTAVTDLSPLINTLFYMIGVVFLLLSAFTAFRKKK